MKFNAKCLKIDNISINDISYFMLGCLCTFAVTYMLPIDIFADDANNNAISTTLCSVVALLTGTAGKAIATIALIFLAIGLFVGKLSWGLAVAIAIGIGGIFGAPRIVDYISGVNGNSCSTISSTFLIDQFNIAFNMLTNIA